MIFRVYDMLMPVAYVWLALKGQFTYKYLV